jgi:hypothetical protein
MKSIAKLKKNLMLTGVLLVFWSFVHPFFLGITHVRINQNQTEAQIELRLFTDDVQRALKTHGIAFNPRVRDSATLSKLQNIMDQKIALWSKGKDTQWKKVPLVLLGFEEESEATWFYLECPELPVKTTRWKFQNTWLFQEHPEQIHVVHAEIGSSYRKSEQLHLKNPAFEF